MQRHRTLPASAPRQRLCGVREGERGRVAALAAEPQRAARRAGVAEWEWYLKELKAFQARDQKPNAVIHQTINLMDCV
jgi:hypothetical protein